MFRSCYHSAWFCYKYQNDSGKIFCFLNHSLRLENLICLRTFAPTWFSLYLFYFRLECTLPMIICFFPSIEIVSSRSSKNSQPFGGERELCVLRTTHLIQENIFTTRGKKELQSLCWTAMCCADVSRTVVITRILHFNDCGWQRKRMCCRFNWRTQVYVLVHVR